MHIIKEIKCMHIGRYFFGLCDMIFFFDDVPRICKSLNRGITSYL